MDQQERQAIIDAEHLKLLPIGYWISAGFWGAYGLFMFAYFGLFGFIFTVGGAAGDAEMPPGIGLAFLGMGLVFLVFVGALVYFKARVGFWIRDRTHYVGTLIVAGITCLEVPYGTLLGVLTFIAMSRPSVRALYEPAEQVAEPVEADPSSAEPSVAEE